MILASAIVKNDFPLVFEVQKKNKKKSVNNINLLTQAFFGFYIGILGKTKVSFSMKLVLKTTQMTKSSWGASRAQNWI